MKQVAAIYDTDVVYGSRLAQYLGQRRKLPFQMVYFTKEEALLQFAGERSIAILIVNEQVMTEPVKALKVKFQIVLTEENNPCIQEYCSLYKYQSAEQIAQKLVAYMEGQGFGEENIWNQTVRMVGIYSPVSYGSLETSFSITLAQMLSKEERIFYLNLGSFSGVDNLFGRENETDLSDAIYYMHQGNLKEKLSGLIQNYGEMDYISPVRCPEDLRTISGEDFVRLLQEIVENRAYETVVLDMAEAMYMPGELLGLCHMIYMPVKKSKQNPVEEGKLKMFWKYLEFNGKIALQSRIHKIELPVYREEASNGHYVEQLIWSEMGDYVRNLLHGTLRRSAKD